MIYDKLLERCPNICTDPMDYHEWLQKRKSSLGGSDAGAIMGYSNYASKLTIYLQKKGMVDDKEMSPAAKRGKLLEPVVRDWFIEAWPDLIIEKVPYMFYSPEYPFMSANLDGLILVKEGGVVTIGGKEISGLGGLEIKSSKTGYGFSQDEIPDGYYTQVQHYMAVLNLPWFVLSACFLETEEIQNYVIFRDEKFISNMIKEEKDFWENYILPGVMPAAIGIDTEEDMITGLFSGGSSTVLLGDEAVSLCAERLEMSNTEKFAKNRKEAIDIDLKALIIKKVKPNPDERKISAIAGPYSISWSRFDMVKADGEALKKAGLFEKFSKTIESGRFAISEKKKGA